MVFTPPQPPTPAPPAPASATGYTVTVSYTGQVAKTDYEVVTYTAIFGSVELADTEKDAQESSQPESPAPTNAPTEKGSSVGNPDGGTSTNITGSGYPAPGTSLDSSGFPTVSGGGSTGGQTTAFTEVTGSMYYSNGSLGTLKIPSIGLTVGVYEGTGSAPLLKGAGHFEGTSIWLGNVCVAGHNRGVRNDFGKIHTLRSGDTITFTTVLGTMTYSVSSVTKVAVTDTSGLSATAHNQITLYTCVEDQPAYRWCVKAVAAS